MPAPNWVYFCGGIKQLGVFRTVARAGSWHTFSLQRHEEESSEQTARVAFPQAPRKI